MRPEPAPALEFRDTGLRYVDRDFPGKAHTALRDVTFRVADGEFVAVVGPTGCGKSSLLNLASGLTRPTSGQILVFGEVLRDLNRRAGYLFQQEALMPWKTALENVTLGLMLAGAPKAAAQEAGRKWLQKVGLAGFGDRYPHQLSDGMRKRVALAQTLLMDPDIILMDEPFSTLDVQTRQMMENELLELWSSRPRAVLFVTHDLDEAIALADRVIVLSAGPGAHVLGDHRVELPRPRDVADIRSDSAFIDLHRTIWRDLRTEVLEGYQQQRRKVLG